MRDIFKGLTIALGGIGFLYHAILFLYDYDHNSLNPRVWGWDIVLGICSPMAAWAVFFLGDWITTGNLPWAKRLSQGNAKSSAA